MLLMMWLLTGLSSPAALVDTWRAEDLSVLNNGDNVGSWTSVGSRTGTAVAGQQPVLVKGATPSGGDVVRFTGDRLTVASSPVGGTTAFSIAIVFRANTAGVNNNAQWWGKSGIIDAEEPGVTADWGTVIQESGRIGIGTGQTDSSTYSANVASVVDGNYHVGVFTWGGGSQSVYVDTNAPMTASGVSTAARNSAGFSIGGIHTGQTDRRFNGDISEIRFYNSALNSSEVKDVVSELTDKYILGNRPAIRSFTADPSEILIGASTTLSWVTTNATSLSIAPDVGTVTGPIGSIQVSPTMTTTYTLTASNAEDTKMAQVTVTVDPGIPIADDQMVTTVQDTPVDITLTGSDPNGSPITFSVVTMPQHGTLNGTAPNLTYTPAGGFYGDDAFTFKVNDGLNDSPPATVAIEVLSPPAAPTDIRLSTTQISATAGPGSFLAAITSVDPNRMDTHTYSLVAGFGDNAMFAIDGDFLRAGPSFAGGPGASFSIRLRSTDNTGRFLEKTFALEVTSTTPTVVINEIHYNPAINTVPEEFIELYNPTEEAVDLSLWQLRGGVDYVLPAGTMLLPGAYLVVAEDPATILARYGVTALGPWAGQLSSDGEEVTLRNPENEAVDRVDFRAEFPWPIAASGEGPSMELVNPSLDNDLGSSWRSSVALDETGTHPTPGQQNTVFAPNAAPNLRQVNHTPGQPTSAETVVITAKVTDPEGVASVSLRVQSVSPGNFIPAYIALTPAELNADPDGVPAPNPDYENPANWMTIAMHDDGLNGDAVAGDDVYSAQVPPRPNRTLVRYRIVVTDLLGASRQAPFEDDATLNFAYFVYDGIPGYEGFSAADLQTLPVYFLITRAIDLEKCNAYTAADQLPQTIGGLANEARFTFNWPGAVVYDGVVYDHIRYRLRGANGRYQNGKRNMRIRFNQGRYLEARDQNGKKYDRKWSTLNTGKGQSNRETLTFGLNEVVNYHLFNLVDVPAPLAFYFHFRVVDGAQEAPDRYNGDFWGLNWAQENYDVRFLEQHDLPKGNLYKLINSKRGALEQLRYQSPHGVDDGSDLDNIEDNLTGFQSTDWLLAHVNYTNWYRYHAVVEGVKHYDYWPSANKNAGWYFEPLYTAANGYRGRMMTLPWDTDSTWGPTWNEGQDVVYNGIFPSSANGGDAGQNPDLQIFYRNTMREVRDLLFQEDQINPIVDTFAQQIAAFIPADLTRWASASSPAGASYNSLAAAGPALSGLAAYVADMKRFMFTGGSWPGGTVQTGGQVKRMDTVATDAAIPNTPTLTYVGTTGFRLDDLRFRSSTFTDPQGAGTFAVMQWRVAEVMPAGTPVTGNPKDLKLEWNALWTSPEIAPFNEFITIPPAYLKAGNLYRVRVRHQDNTGRWSHWSNPIEFRPLPADVVGALRDGLVFSEIMYNPPAEGATDGDEFEFLEVKNAGDIPLDLTGLFFSGGINFAFPNGTMLSPGQIFLLARNPAVLATRYPGVIVDGTYTGKLDNSSETVAISHPAAGVIVSVTYSDRAPWPVTADGFGYSLVLIDAAMGRYAASAERNGSPGVEGMPTSLGGVVVNEVLSSSTAPSVDYIELHNTGASTMDIGGWYLTDAPTYPWKYRIPDGTMIAPGGYVFIDEHQFNPTPGQGVSFALSSLGDDVYLFSGDAGFELTGYSHGFEFGGAQNGVAFGRYVNSVGEEQFPAQITNTPNAPNAPPRVGPIIMSEIHYHPRVATDEFLELHNLSGNPVSLFDPAHATNTWRVSGLGFDFPTGTTLPAQGYLLLVAGEPTAFRARFNVPATVPILQYAGNLQDSGENLELRAPDEPTTNGVPYYVVDQVRYNDRSPWPLAADGDGASLQRRQDGQYGNDPVNWLAADPTPGLPRGGGDAPVIMDQPASREVVAYQTVSLNVTANGTGPLFYQWRFGNEPLQGETNATLVLENFQLNQAGVYAATVFNSAGSAETAPAELFIVFPATITQPPQSVALRIQPDPAAAPTTNATFSVTAITYHPPLSYQWRFNGVDLPGATGDTYTVTDVQLEDEGDYTVVVTDAIGPIESAPARLSPLIAPTFTQGPLGQEVATGSQVTLSGEVFANPLPFLFEWRLGSTVVLSNLVNRRYDYYTFTAPATPTSLNYRLAVRTAAGILATPFVSIVVVADTDGDGMTDNWENANSLNPNDPSDRDLDADGDGQTNGEEYTSGTNPRDSASYLKVEISSDMAGAVLRFQAEPAKTYTVEYTDDLTTGSWSRLADVIARGPQREETVRDAAGTPNRYYRLVTPIQP